MTLDLSINLFRFGLVICHLSAEAEEIRLYTKIKIAHKSEAEFSDLKIHPKNKKPNHKERSIFIEKNTKIH